MHDRCFQFPRQLHQFGVGAIASGTPKDGHLPRLVENAGGPGNLFVGRPNRCVNLWEVKTRRGTSYLTQSDITGENNNCYASFGECGLDCDLQDTRHLLRLRNDFAVVTAFAKYAFPMSLLEILSSDFATRNMACNREYRNATAVGIVQSINQSADSQGYSSRHTPPRSRSNALPQQQQM